VIRQSIELHAHRLLLRLDENAHNSAQSLQTMGARLEAVEKGQAAMEKMTQTMEKKMQTQPNVMFCLLAVLAVVVLAKRCRSLYGTVAGHKRAHHLSHFGATGSATDMYSSRRSLHAAMQLHQLARTR
jgi:hypothetical protein